MLLIKKNLIFESRELYDTLISFFKSLILIILIILYVLYNKNSLKIPVNLIYRKFSEKKIKKFYQNN